jgi:hypothetical protein
MDISDADRTQFLQKDFYNSLRFMFEGAIAWHAWKQTLEKRDQFSSLFRHQGVLGMYATFTEARALYEFFQNHESRRNDRDDAHADDFAPNWRAAESEVYKNYVAHSKPANKRMFHLVYRRDEKSGETSSQGPLKDQVLNVAKDLLDIAGQFFENIDDSECRERARTALQKALDEGQKAARHYCVANPLDPKAISPLLEDETQGGWRIVYDRSRDPDLIRHYMEYDHACFDGSLPDIDLVWAKSIRSPEGQHAHGLYVSEESPERGRYIALDEKLSDMFGLERFCLLHEMVHAKLDPILGHGDEFLSELKRVLDAIHWEVLIGD